MADGSEFVTVVFGLASGRDVGVGDFSGRLASRRSPVVTVTLLSQVTGLILMVGLAVGRAERLLSARDAFWGGLAYVDRPPLAPVTAPPGMGENRGYLDWPRGAHRSGEREKRPLCAAASKAKRSEYRWRSNVSMSPVEQFPRRTQMTLGEWPSRKLRWWAAGCR